MDNQKVVQIVYSNGGLIEIFHLPAGSDKAEKLKKYAGFYLGATLSARETFPECSEEEFVELTRDMHYPVVSELESRFEWQASKDEPCEIAAIYVMGVIS